MHCQQAQEQLNAFWDGELPPRQREDLERHVKYCPGCQQALAHFWQMADLLQGDSLPPVPQGFTDRVLTRAYQRQPRPFARPRPFWDPIQWWNSVSVWQRTAAAAVLLIGVTLGSLMGWQTGPRPPHSSAQQPAPEDPVAVYNLDYLGGAPEGSLPKAYLQLVSTPTRSGD